MSEENELPDGWIFLSLNELVVNTKHAIKRGPFGSAIKKEFFVSKGYKVYEQKNVIYNNFNLGNYYIDQEKYDELKDFELKSGDIVISCSGTIGEIAIVPPNSEKGIINQALLKITLDEKKVISKFFILLFKFNLQSILLDNTRGSAMQNIASVQVLKQVLFPIPSLSQQKRIISEIEQQFTCLDSAITALQHAKAKLKRYRASVLKAAVEGKLTEAWRAEHPTTEPASVLLERILIERRAKWEADLRAKGKDPAKVKYVEPAMPDVENLPEVPEGWCWTSFGQCFEVHVGATPSRKEPTFWGGKIPWVSSGEVQFCRILQTRESITQEGLKNSSTQINPAGSVLLGMIGEGKTRGQVAILDIEACNNQNCAAIWISQASVLSEYIYYWLWSQYDITRQGSSGNNQPALNKSRVEQMIFPLAPLAEQEQIVAEIERRLSIVIQVEIAVNANLKRAERLRQSILKEAFAGRLVPQDPNDEPASVLLERIHKEREGQKQGPIKKTRAMKTISVPRMPDVEPMEIDASEMEQMDLWANAHG